MSTEYNYYIYGFLSPKLITILGTNFMKGNTQPGLIYANLTIVAAHCLLVNSCENPGNITHIFLGDLSIFIR